MSPAVCELRGCITPTSTGAPVCAGHLQVIAGQVRRAVVLADWLGLPATELGQALDDLTAQTEAGEAGGLVWPVARGERDPWPGERCLCGRPPRRVVEVPGHGAVAMCGVPGHGSHSWAPAGDPSPITPPPRKEAA